MGEPSSQAGVPPTHEAQAGYSTCRPPLHTGLSSKKSRVVHMMARGISSLCELCVPGPLPTRAAFEQLRQDKRPGAEWKIGHYFQLETVGNKVRTSELRTMNKKDQDLFHFLMGSFQEITLQCLLALSKGQSGACSCPLIPRQGHFGSSCRSGPDVNPSSLFLRVLKKGFDASKNTQRVLKSDSFLGSQQSKNYEELLRDPWPTGNLVVDSPTSILGLKYGLEHFVVGIGIGRL